MKRAMVAAALCVLMGVPAWADTNIYPLTPEQQKVVTDTENVISWIGANLAEHANDPAELRRLTPGVDAAIRQVLHPTLGTPYPCPTKPGTAASDIAATYTCIIAIGLGALENATTMNNTIASGRCSGASLRAESNDLLIGDYTSAPRGKDGFVNIGNKFCFWRDTGERVACPPPEPECMPAAGH